MTSDPTSDRDLKEVLACLRLLEMIIWVAAARGDMEGSQ